MTPSDFTLIRQYEAAAALFGRVTLTGVEKLATHPDVVGVGINVRLDVTLSQSGPLIHADQTRFLGIDGTGMNVAVLDTGIDTDHPDLSDSIIGEKCFLRFCPAGPNSAEDDQGHGTNVSGIITSNGSVTPVGVDALSHIAQRGFQDDFVNMSFGDSNSYGPGNCPSDSARGAIETQIDLLLLNGVLSFAASGEEGTKSAITWPACIPSVVSVGGVYDADIGLHTWEGPIPACTDTTTAPDKVGCGSPSSDDLDLLAPGCSIVSTAIGGGEIGFCGTSQAVPHAVGVAALVKQTLPTLPAVFIPARMRSAGTWVKDDFNDGDPGTFRWTQRVDARVAFLVDDFADFDQDGCSDFEEFGPSATLGGQRNPLWFWDFYDVPAGTPPARDERVNILDIGAINLRFGATGDPTGDPLSPPPAAPAYHTAFDRSSPSGTDLWNLGAANGQINIIDIGAAVVQFGHTCSAPP